MSESEPSQDDSSTLSSKADTSGYMGGEARLSDRDLCRSFVCYSGVCTPELGSSESVANGESGSGDLRPCCEDPERWLASISLSAFRPVVKYKFADESLAFASRHV